MILEETDDFVVLEPTQDLFEGGECDEMEAALGRLAARGAQVVVDLKGVQHVTARCLGILAHAHREASPKGGCILLCGTRRMHRWLLRKTGLAEVLSVHADVESARRHLATRPRAIA